MKKGKKKNRFVINNFVCLLLSGFPPGHSKNLYSMTLKGLSCPEIALHKQLHVMHLMASSEASSKATLFGF